VIDLGGKIVPSHRHAQQELHPRHDVYPAHGDSMRPAGFIFDKIRYAGVFEEGAFIRGQPFLWLPLAGVPLRRGRPMTPGQYARSVGPLVSVERPGKPSLLFAKNPAPGDEVGAQPPASSASRSTSGYRASQSPSASTSRAQPRRRRRSCRRSTPRT
jgi:hypothetical protein